MGRFYPALISWGLGTQPALGAQVPLHLQPLVPRGEFARSAALYHFYHCCKWLHLSTLLDILWLRESFLEGADGHRKVPANVPRALCEGKIRVAIAALIALQRGRECSALRAHFGVLWGGESLVLLFGRKAFAYEA